MFKKLIFLIIFLFVFGAIALPMAGLLAYTESTNYIIWADVFGSGGSATSTSDSYSLHDTMAEAMILSATSTATNYGIKAGFQEMYYDQYLTFSILDTDIDLGDLDVASATTASQTMTISTNATNGFTITVSGDTLQNGGESIDAIGATAEASAAGTEQFGINLVDNTDPDIGLDPSGTIPIGSAASNYDTADSFAFDDTTATIIAHASNDINATTFTISYLANIAQATVIGAYSTTLTYAATANY